MAGAIGLGDFRIILGALVDIVDVQRDRGAGGAPLEHPGEDADLVRLLPLGSEARLAGAAAIEEGLEVLFAEAQPRRAAIDHGAERRTMALAPGSEAEHATEAVERHRRTPSVWVEIAGRFAGVARGCNPFR